MRLKIIMILLVLVSASQAQDELGETILKSGLFGCYQEENIDSSFEKYFLSKVDSISKAETVRGVGSQLHIYHKYSFKELPCINLYILRDQHSLTLENLKPYFSIFYNECDSTFCPSNGNAIRFSKLAKPLLPEIIDSDVEQVLKLCMLFLYTAGRKPILSMADYEDVWTTVREDLSDRTREYMEYTEKDIKKDIKLVKNAIHPNDMLRPVYFSKEEDHYRFAVSAWNPFYGDIEQWWFVISDNVFEVESIARKLERVGPYFMKERDQHKKSLKK